MKYSSNKNAQIIVIILNIPSLYYTSFHFHFYCLQLHSTKCYHGDQTILKVSKTNLSKAQRELEHPLSSFNCSGSKKEEVKTTPCNIDFHFPPNVLHISLINPNAFMNVM